MRLKGFANGAYRSQSLIAAGEKCINLFPERVPSGNKTQMMLVPAPGMSEFATLPKAPGRGIFCERGRLFAVGGNALYEIDSTGATVTARGDLVVDANPVTISTNGDGGEELLVTSGGRGDILALDTNTFFPGEVNDITFAGQLDGFFAGLHVDAAAQTSTMKISESFDGQTWDGTQIAQRTAASDPWQAMIIVKREIFLFGEKTGEVWFNARRSPFPFAQRSGAFFEVGIVAPFSLHKFGGSMAWLGRDEAGTGAVYWMNGYTPEEISTAALRWEISQYEEAGRIDDAIGWGYEREKHRFYVLKFPSAGRTWVYDAETNLWHERGFWSSDAQDFLNYRPQLHAVAFGRNLVCDSDSGKIYSLSSTVYRDVDDEELRRVRRSPHLSNENKRLFFPYFELECDRGVGLLEGQGSDPQVGLRYSNDGGSTWGETRFRSLGARGQTGTRVRWDMCGSGRDRVWELWSSDPVATRWHDAYVGAR